LVRPNFQLARGTDLFSAGGKNQWQDGLLTFQAVLAENSSTKQVVYFIVGVCMTVLLAVWL
jgi:hypothetical protein